METRKVNVMGKEMQIPKGMTFGELAKEFEGEVFGKILVAKQGNSLRELICPIRTDEDITFLDFRDKEGVRVYERGISLLLVKAVRDVLGTATGVENRTFPAGQSLLRAAQPTAGAGCRSACQD